MVQTRSRVHPEPGPLGAGQGIVGASSCCTAERRAMVVVVIGALLTGRALAHGEAFRNAGTMTAKLANQVCPLIPDAANGDPTRLAELNRAIADRKSAGFLKLVTIWGADGRVIYADDASQIGRRLPPPAEVTSAITEGTQSAEFESQPEASNETYDGNGPGFVEVYVPLTLPDGARVAFEAYYDYPRAAADADRLFRQFLPLVLALLLLLIIQLPVAALVRQVRRHRAERRGLADAPFAGTGKDRIQVAANLHDGPIQDIAGVGYALGAVALSVPEQGQPMMRQAQQSLQRAQQSLRRLMVDLYPLDLSSARCPARSPAWRARCASMASTCGPRSLPFRHWRRTWCTPCTRGHTRRWPTSPSTPTPPASTSIWPWTTNVPGCPSRNCGSPTTASALIPTTPTRRPTGHDGLRVLDHRLTELGGSLTMASRPGQGTTVLIELPDTGEHRG